MKNRQFIEALESLAPLHAAESWDNCGLLAGSREKEINTVYVALDATDKAVEEAVRQKADLLLTHHPLLFKNIKSITDDTFTGRRLITLIKEDIACYAMHTNFDVKVMGELAGAYMGLTKREVLLFTNETEGFGSVGMLPGPVSLQSLCGTVKEVFSLDGVKVFGNPEQELVRAAIMPGSGKSSIQSALDSGAGVLITGDIDHHEGIDAVAQGLAVIDAGHYGIEHIFVNYMKEYINKNFHDIKVITEKMEHPFRFIS